MIQRRTSALNRDQFEPDREVRAAIQPFAQAWAGLLADVRELDDLSLQLLARADQEFTTVNCCWAEYDVGKKVSIEARVELRKRAEQAEAVEHA